MPNRQPTIPDVRVITPEDAQRLCRLCLCDQQLCEAPEQQQNDDAAERNGWLAVDNELDQLFAQLSGGQPVSKIDWQRYRNVQWAKCRKVELRK